jgi:hypothetical protein
VKEAKRVGAATEGAATAAAATEGAATAAVEREDRVKEAAAKEVVATAMVMQVGTQGGSMAEAAIEEVMTAGEMGG